MNHFTDEQVENAMDLIRQKEREILSEVLKHLQEIDRRKLFSKRGFSSLFDYALKHLKYSPDQAGRRIAAMRLLRQVPEFESKVSDGSLTLSSLAQAHWHFNKVEHTKAEKIEVLAKLQNASKRETRAILKQEDVVRYSFAADANFEAVVERLKGLHPHLNFDQLMKKVCELAIEKLDPAKKFERVQAKELNKKRAQSFTSAGKISTVDQPESAGKIGTPKQIVSAGSQVVSRTLSNCSRYIAMNIKREVWFRDKGQCQNCKAKFALEYDHITPFRMGGASAKENLRLLCRNCNQRKGIERYGADQMNRHLQ